jgi:hypothetical protein
MLLKTQMSIILEKPSIKLIKFPLKNRYFQSALLKLWFLVKIQIDL